ncbi:MAG TPA: NADH-quinone oxidoreductase subunit C [Roseiflexaceae bacterium]|nr:NADH-quinone oxidoreductase subunit C [Roseiflexaceae bacterium]HMP40068.1 NADH-quinone oxidoreductase subunit C [Roseiflexaceae bacterium]
MPSLSADELRGIIEQELPGALHNPAVLCVVPARLPEVARLLCDILDHTFLSNLTAVDYPADGEIEVVYHIASLGGGVPLVLRVRTPREHASVPSLTSLWPGAALQEREAYDLFGVWFEGHPDLRRVYMWDAFEGFPMRKDFPRQGDKYFAGSGEE